mgnify:CR=1 FL=1
MFTLIPHSQTSGREAEAILFVDDAAANAFNVFLHFAHKEELHKEGHHPQVLSVWWPPPASVNADLALPLHSMCLETLQQKYLDNK